MNQSHSILVEVINTNTDNTYNESISRLVRNKIIDSINRCISELNDSINKCDIKVIVKEKEE